MTLFINIICMLFMEIGVIISLMRGIEESLFVVPLASVGFFLCFLSLMDDMEFSGSKQEEQG
jgi:hypothetical protein